MVRQLYPWIQNLGKRQVKSPKIYFRDSGILHYLADIQTMRDLESNPLLGASWEGFALETLLMGVPEEYAFFWSTYSGAELDLLLIKGTKRAGFEFKYTSKPKTTKSMHSACESLNLDHLYIVYPGEHDFPLTDRIEAVSLSKGRKMTMEFIL